MTWFARKAPCHCHRDGFDPLAKDGLCHMCGGVPVKPKAKTPEPEAPRVAMTNEQYDQVMVNCQEIIDMNYSQRIAEAEHKVAELTKELKIANAVIAALKEVVKNQ